MCRRWPADVPCTRLLFGVLQQAATQKLLSARRDAHQIWSELKNNRSTRIFCMCVVFAFTRRQNDFPLNEITFACAHTYAFVKKSRRDAYVCVWALCFRFSVRREAYISRPWSKQLLLSTLSKHKATCRACWKAFTYLHMVHVCVYLIYGSCIGCLLMKNHTHIHNMRLQKRSHAYGFLIMYNSFSINDRLQRYLATQPHVFMYKYTEEENYNIDY